MGGGEILVQRWDISFPMLNLLQRMDGRRLTDIFLSWAVSHLCGPTTTRYDSFCKALRMWPDSKPRFGETSEIVFPTITAAEIHDKGRGLSCRRRSSFCNLPGSLCNASHAVWKASHWLSLSSSHWHWRALLFAYMQGNSGTYYPYRIHPCHCRTLVLAGRVYKHLGIAALTHNFHFSLIMPKSSSTKTVKKWRVSQFFRYISDPVPYVALY